MTLSIVFYDPEGDESLSLLGKIWYYKLICVTIPMVCILGWAMAYILGEEYWKYEIRAATKRTFNKCEKYGCIILIGVVFFSLWVFGGCLACLVFEIGMFGEVAFITFLINSERFNSSLVLSLSLLHSLLRPSPHRREGNGGILAKLPPIYSKWI